MEAQLKSSLDNLTQEVRGLREELLRTKQELRQHHEAVQTRLLDEFWKWARTADLRYRQSTAIMGALDDRVQLIEDRVAELERQPRRP